MRKVFATLGHHARPPPSDVGTAQAGVLPAPVFIPSGRMVAHPEGVARTEQHAAPRHHYGPFPPTLPSSPHSHLLHLPLLSPGQHWLAPPFWVAQEERSLFPDELFVLLKRALVFVSIAPAVELTCPFDPCSRTMTPRRSRPCTLCLTRLRRARSSLPQSGRPSPRRRVQGTTSVRREFQVRPAVPRPQPCGTAVLA